MKAMRKCNDEHSRSYYLLPLRQIHPLGGLANITSTGDGSHISIYNSAQRVPLWRIGVLSPWWLSGLSPENRTMDHRR
jgi:hypothetical protein